MLKYNRLAGDTSQVLLFPLHKIKMSKQYRFFFLNYLSHISLVLTISKVFTILCLLCLCGNREYPCSFQNKSVSSSFKWVPIVIGNGLTTKSYDYIVPRYILFMAKLKGEGRSFWSGKAQLYLLNCILHRER